MTDGTGVRLIDPVALGGGRVLYAPGVRAGGWVFATGHMAQDYGAGIAAEVLRPGAPHRTGSKRGREAAYLFDAVERVLAAAGSVPARIVRTDQYYSSVAMVPPFQAARRRRLGALIPPSTSIVQRGLLLPGAELDWQVVALAGDEPEVRHLDDAALRARPSSGYSPALTAGSFVFLSGNTAMAQGDEPRRGGVALAALIEEGLQWGGEPLRREAEFIVAKRLLPSLAIAGAGPDDVVKAQIYLTEPGDYGVLAEVWREHFGDARAALSIIPCAARGLAPIGGRIEINLIAHPDGASVDAGVAMPFAGQAQAVRAGDLLFLSALMAADADGLKPEAAVDPRQPWFRDGAEAQADIILDAAEALCAAAGTTLANIVRAQHFLTDLGAFYAVHRAWRQRLPGRPVPFSAVEVPAPLPVPGATVMMDLWVYAPAPQ